VDFRYCVDGYEFPDEESCLLGDGAFPPFRIFDIEAQDYVGPTYNSRESAELVCEDMERNRICLPNSHDHPPQ
jgi:hypothetical protein